MREFLSHFDLNCITNLAMLLNNSPIILKYSLLLHVPIAIESHCNHLSSYGCDGSSFTHDSQHRASVHDETCTKLPIENPIIDD